MRYRANALVTALLAVAAGTGPAAAQLGSGVDLVVEFDQAAPRREGPKMVPSLAAALQLQADFLGLDRRGRPVVRTTDQTPQDLDIGAYLLGDQEVDVDLGPGEYEPVQELLIVYKDVAGFAADEIAGLQVTRVYEPRGMLVVRHKGRIPWQALDSLKEDDRVESVEPNIRLSSTPVIEVAEAVPNDPFYVIDRQWGLHEIEIERAWKRQIEQAQMPASPLIVAVLDSGVEFDHIDLAGNIWVNPQETEDGTDEDGNGFVDDIHGADFVDGDGVPQDQIGHGTHIAGIIGAVGHNGQGIVGVNWPVPVQIMALRVKETSGEETVEIDRMIKAIEYAADRGARVINMSWETDSDSPQLRKAIEDHPEILFVAAAGNAEAGGAGKEINSANPVYPAYYGVDLENLISVMATDQQNKRFELSNFGAKSVHLAAPGAPVFSTFTGGSFAARSGTSMAAAYVSGVAALLWTIEEYQGCTPEQIRQLMLDHVTQTTELSSACESGGVLSLFFLKFDPEPCAP